MSDNTMELKSFDYMCTKIYSYCIYYKASETGFMVVTTEIYSPAFKFEFTLNLHTKEQLKFPKISSASKVCCT